MIDYLSKVEEKEEGRVGGEGKIPQVFFSYFPPSVSFLFFTSSALAHILQKSPTCISQS